MRLRPEHEAPSAGPQEGKSAARLEAFTDGVIAVIITIMVLDLHVPKDDSIRGLLQLWPTVLAYVISFLFVAIYWINHHHMFHGVRQINSAVLWANNLWLLVLSFIPFCTNYLGEKHMTPLAVRLYAADMFACGLCFILTRVALAHVRRANNEVQATGRSEFSKNAVAITLYAIAIACSGRLPMVSLAIIALVAVAYVLPEFLLHERNTL